MSQTGKPVVTFMLSSKRNRHKSHKWFSGHCSRIGGTPDWLIHRLGVIAFCSAIHASNWVKHVAENKYIPSVLGWKMAWLVTDCMNGACGMERKEATEAVWCWGVCKKWKRNEMQGVEVRNERSFRNVVGWNECAYRKHMDKLNSISIYFSAQLIGGGEILRFSRQQSWAKTL